MVAKMRASRRMLMKEWLFRLLEEGSVPGITWENRSQAVFKVDWKHGSRHGYSLERDAIVFKKWAEHTGKFQGAKCPDPKRWKANFRCALNSLKDIEKLSGTVKCGPAAYRLFRFHSGNAKKIKQEPGKREHQRCLRFCPNQAIKVEVPTNDCQIVPEMNQECVEMKQPETINTGRCFEYPLLTPPVTPNSNNEDDFLSVHLQESLHLTNEDISQDITASSVKPEVMAENHIRELHVCPPTPPDDNDMMETSLWLENIQDPTVKAIINDPSSERPEDVITNQPSELKACPLMPPDDTNLWLENIHNPTFNAIYDDPTTEWGTFGRQFNPENFFLNEVLI